MNLVVEPGDPGGDLCRGAVLEPLVEGEDTIVLVHGDKEDGLLRAGMVVDGGVDRVGAVGLERRDDVDLLVELLEDEALKVEELAVAAGGQLIFGQFGEEGVEG